MNGIVAEWVTTLSPVPQASVIGVGIAGVAVGAWILAGHVLRVEDDGAELSPALTWARGYQPPTVGRDTRADRLRLWREENQQSRQPGRHRTASETVRADDPAGRKATRVFGDVLPVDLPELPQRTHTNAPPPPAVGKAVVPVPLDVPVTDPERVDLDAVLAELRAWDPKAPDATQLIPTVVSWKGYRQ